MHAQKKLVYPRMLEDLRVSGMTVGADDTCEAAQAAASDAGGAAIGSCWSQSCSHLPQLQPSGVYLLKGRRPCTSGKCTVKELLEHLSVWHMAHMCQCLDVKLFITLLMLAAQCIAA